MQRLEDRRRVADGCGCAAAVVAAAAAAAAAVALPLHFGTVAWNWLPIMTRACCRASGRPLPTATGIPPTANDPAGDEGGDALLLASLCCERRFAPECSRPRALGDAAA